MKLDNPLVVQWEYASEERLATVDVAPRTVELTRARGIDVDLGNVQSLPFGYENGEIALAPYFTQIERREANGTVVFPDRSSMVDFVAATTTRSHLADHVPELTEPFHTRSTYCVFVAGKS